MGYELKYIHLFKDRHGKVRVYYRRHGRRIPISSPEGSPEFLAEYAKIHATFERSDDPKQVSGTPGTIGFLVAEYLSNRAFTSMRTSSQTEYRRHLDPFREKLGHIKLTGLSRRVLLAYRDDLAASARTTNNALSYIRRLLNFAVERGVIKANPAAEIKPLKEDGDGWEPWPEEALERFAEKSRSVSRIAYYLARFTGQRRGDILAMRWDAIHNGIITVRQQKTGATVYIPVHPRLRTELERVKADQLERTTERSRKGQPVAESATIIAKRTGERYTDDGFAAIWNREQHHCQCPGLPFHGLRKNAVIALFEVGCTHEEVMAITGHTTYAMVSHYAKRVDQKKLAKSAMKKLIDAETHIPDEIEKS